MARFHWMKRGWLGWPTNKGSYLAPVGRDSSWWASPSSVRASALIANEWPSFARRSPKMMVTINCISYDVFFSREVEESAAYFSSAWRWNHPQDSAPRICALTPVCWANSSFSVRWCQMMTGKRGPYASLHFFILPPGSRTATWREHCKKRL